MSGFNSGGSGGNPFGSEVDLSEMQTIADQRIVGNVSGGTAVPAALTAAQVRTMLSLVIGTDVQAYDADLTTWASLTPSANAQSLVTAANYAAMRALLDLEAGTDFLSPAAIAAAYQPLDADLTTWAGVTPGTGVATALAIAVGSSGAIIVNAGALGTPSSGTLTNCTGLPVAGITASTSTALGVGSVELGHASDTTLARTAAGRPTCEGVELLRSTITGPTVTFTETDNGNSGTADTIDWTAGNKQKSTLTGNCTFTFTAPAGPTSLVLKLVQDGTGSRTVTWPAAVHWSGGTAPTLTTTASKVDIICFYYDGSTYFGTSSLNYTA